MKKNNFSSNFSSDFKSDFSLKIFAGITCILLGISLLVFAGLRYFIPKIYEKDLFSRMNVDAAEFMTELQNSDRISWDAKLTAFCNRNNLNASIYKQSGDLSIVAGLSLSAVYDYTIKHRDYDVTSALRYFYVPKDGRRFLVIIYINPQSLVQVADTFNTIFPVLLGVFVIISLFVAFFYTRFVVKNRKLQTAVEEMSRRRDFFSAISHELKTPLTILKGQLDGMILRVGKFKDRDKYLTEAYNTTLSIETLVKEIMTAAKLDIIKLLPEEIKLSELINESLSNMAELIEEKQIIITKDVSPKPVTADRKLLSVVMSNIIGNAVKHSPEGAVITIAYDEDRLLTVRNTGSRPEAATAADNGLGLYIVKSILDMHGFSWSFENTYESKNFTIIFT
jgi:two-component system sensor histidine kinase VanS